MDNRKNNHADFPAEPSAGSPAGGSAVSSSPVHGFSYVMTPAHYRGMLYFNTFARQRGKSWFILFSWTISVVLLILERLGVIPPMDPVAHGCLMLVAVCFPALVLTMEYSVRKFRKRNPEEFQLVRSVTFNNDGVVLSGMGDGGKAGSMVFEKWESFPTAYETRSMFLLYRDNRQVTLIPKSAIPEAEQGFVRALMQSRMGGRFVRRS